VLIYFEVAANAIISSTFSIKLSHQLGLAYWQKDQRLATETAQIVKNLIAQLENLHTQSNDNNSRANYLFEKERVSDLAIHLLMLLHQDHPQAHYTHLALEISESKCARSLLDQVTSANVDIRQDIDPQLLTKEKAL
jgi:hypothetical protein